MSISSNLIYILKVIPIKIATDLNGTIISTFKWKIKDSKTYRDNWRAGFMKKLKFRQCGISIGYTNSSI